MNYVMDLSNLDTDRFIIVGDVQGEHDKLISLLYQQKFTYKDTLVLTGNFIGYDGYAVGDNQSAGTLGAMTFLKNVMNGYSVKGKNEFDFLRKIDETKLLPAWLSVNPKHQEILKFIEELPLIIKVSPYIYIVSAGLVPGKPIDRQDPEVFYSIGSFDKDSRFYQFENPDQKSWYDFDFFDGDKTMKFCFGMHDIGKTEVPAGYSLGRTPEKPLKALIIRKGQEDKPIILEM
jgi:hypothetical protein